MSLPNSRRHFLKTSGLAFCLLNSIFRSRYVLANSTAPNVYLFTLPNGLPEEFFWPTGSGANFNLTPTMSSFNALKSKMIFYQGAHLGPNNQNNHNANWMTLYTGIRPTGGNVLSPSSYKFQGESIDYNIARTLKQRTPLAMIGIKGGQYIDTTTTPGKGQRAQPVTDGAAVFKNYFSKLPTDNKQSIEKILKSRKSLLDFITRDLSSIQKELVGSEKEKLEQNIDSYQRLEAIMAKEHTVTSTACSTLNPPGGTGYFDKARGHIDLMYNLASCNLIDSASYPFAADAHPSVGHRQDFHGFTHKWREIYTGNQTANIKLYSDQISFYMGQIARFCEKLNSVSIEGGKTLLDNSIVVVSSNFALDSRLTNDHSNFAFNKPKGHSFLIINGDNGPLKTGQYIKETPSQLNHCKMLTSILNAAGVPAKGFGQHPNSGTLSSLI